MRVSRFVLPAVAAISGVALVGPPASATVPSVPAAATASVAAATTPKLGFQSNAWGTNVTAIDKTIKSGPTS
ncbi:hypothetical protein [Knoellia subterranea]|uniref:Uncharacterized protein n=1 Tax=Knoellia subterranea KCTC 19937 TaxID=1385521 RepID=A0A0A0JQB0_9MICO|nr:hypothetical protein [Knoellia subterranea]KGN39640.1 hypothetical protein N803_03550 [Knoellia subterranea KCTC 19937]